MEVCFVDMRGVKLDGLSSRNLGWTQSKKG